MSDWKPGDVALVTAYNRPEPYRAYFDGNTWRECGANMFCVDVPTSVRPLVTLDPEDREQAERLIRTWLAADDDVPTEHGIDTMQSALRSLIAPPKPAEPGKYGAVIAGDGREWFRYTTTELRGRDWCRPGTVGGTEYATWGDLDVVRVTNEGVQP